MGLWTGHSDFFYIIYRQALFVCCFVCIFIFDQSVTACLGHFSTFLQTLQ